MHIELPRTTLFTDTNFPNHSYANISEDKVTWFVEALKDSSTDIYRNEVALVELKTMVNAHYSFVRKQYELGRTTAEGIPMRRSFENSPLEKAILIAWTMNCVFYPTGMFTPPQLEQFEYFSKIRLNYPNLYNLFLEWAWG
jgi:hypothetical protein